MSGSVVVVKCSGQTALKEGEVQTEIPFAHHLPFEVVLVDRLSADTVDQHSVEHRRGAVTAASHDAGGVGWHIVVTEQSEARSFRYSKAGLSFINSSSVITQPAPTEGKKPHFCWYLLDASARKVAVARKRSA